MAKIEDQRILVWCNNQQNLIRAVFDAALLSLKLEKELCLFANFSKRDECKELTDRVNNLAAIVKNEIPKLEVTVLVLEGKLLDLIKPLGESYNTILLCFACKMNYKLLKAFYRARFPFFFAKNDGMKANPFQKVLIPVDFRESTKDALLWGSYLGRLNQSDVILLKASDKYDSDLQAKVNRSVESTQKLYQKLAFNYQIENGKVGSWRIHAEAMKKSEAFDLMIFSGSLNVTPLDYVLGPFEKRIINNSKCPVILINPQKEMYLICS